MKTYHATGSDVVAVSLGGEINDLMTATVTYEFEFQAHDWHKANIIAEKTCEELACTLVELYEIDTKEPENEFEEVDVE